MINPAMTLRRLIIAGALAVCFLLLWRGPWRPGLTEPHDRLSSWRPLPHVENYFEQVYSAGDPAPYGYAALKDACDHVQWREDDYLRCGGMGLGLTSVISQVKVCLKMAVESGSNLVLPAMPLRDATDLLNWNLLNGDALMPYDQWFDAEHLRNQMGRACPKMKIVHPDELDATVPVKNRWRITVTDAPGFHKYFSYFWAGRPFKKYFDSQYHQLQAMAMADHNSESKMGITLIDIDAEFLVFRIMDDPTRRDLKLWNDLSHLVRFREQERLVVHRLLRMMPRPFFGVHFRVENDSTLWTSLENQLRANLESLDKAWDIYGQPDQDKPLVYLACGDPSQAEKFVTAGMARGWEVTHKWRLAAGDLATVKIIDDLPFDFQGAIDMGIMLRSQFFFGITGSAFSSTVANQRDITGRYRGSSFDVIDDEGARSHLFDDIDSTYPCCL